MHPIPLATRFYKNRSLPVSTQNVVNMYAEFLDSDNKSRVVMHLRPGKKLFQTVGSGPIRGTHKLNGALYVVSGQELYSVSSDAIATLIGPVPGVGRVGMAANIVGQLCMVNGTDTGYYFSDSKLTTAVLTGAAYTVVYSDGYFIFESAGTNTWFISSNTDGTSFDSTEIGATNDKEDNNVAVIESQGRVFIFGEESLEAYYVSTDIDFPYIKDHGLSTDKGVLARESLASVDEVIFWLGDDKEVYNLSGLQIRRITDPSMSYEIEKMAVVSDAVGYAYAILSHTFYILTFPTENKSYTYDATTGLWATCGELVNGTTVKDRGNNHVYAYGKHLVGDHTNGNLYEIDPDTYTDNGSIFRWELTLPPVHADHETFFMGQIKIGLEPGVGLTTGQGSDPQLFMSMSLDAKTWYTERWSTVGKIGEYLNNVVFNRNPKVDDQIFIRLAGSDPVKWAINGVYIDL